MPSILRRGLAALFMSAALVGGASAQDTVKIGVGLGTTGQMAFLSQQYLKGLQTAVDVVNEGGGVHGRKIELVVRDHKGVPAEAVGVAKRLVEQDRVAIVDIDLPSSVAIAAEAVTKDAKIPQVAGYTFSPKAVEQGNPWYFQTSTTSDLIADALARTIHKMPNNKTIAMLAPNDDYGRATIGSLKDALGRLGGPQVVFDDYYEATQNDFSAILLKMRSTNPDSLYIDVRYPAAVTVLTQMAEFGIKKPVFGGVNFYNPKLIEQAGKLLEGVQIYVNWAPEFTDPASEEFKKQYQRLQKDVPDSNASLGWTAGMVMANALKSAGRNADAEAIRAALAKTDWMSPQGPIKFDAKGASNAPAHVLQFKDGRWNVVN